MHHSKGKIEQRNLILVLVQSMVADRTHLVFLLPPLDLSYDHINMMNRIVVMYNNALLLANPETKNNKA